MLIVQKYGGATLATPALVKAAAHRIANLKRQGHQVVAIVSAMGQATNDLIDLARQVADQPNLRELDMLLSTGERVSMALLSMALHAEGCDSISFTGSQAGIMTNDAHINAFIVDVRAFRVREALDAGKVVVLAGFQGVSPTTKEITTLGRGGSDTTAMAMSAFLKADRCEILKEVPAVFSADPRIVKNAKALSQLPYQALAHMCFWGAKVLHYRSAELAARYKVPLFVGPAADNGAHTTTGTWIKEFSGENAMYENTQVLSLNSQEHVVTVSIPAPTASAGLEKLREFLKSNEIGWPQILQTEEGQGDAKDQVHFTFTAPPEQVLAFLNAASGNPVLTLKTHLSTVTGTCAGAVSMELNQKVLQTLSEASLKFTRFQISSNGFTIFCSRDDRVKILDCLHSTIV